MSLGLKWVCTDLWCKHEVSLENGGGGSESGRGDTSMERGVGVYLMGPDWMSLF